MGINWQDISFLLTARRLGASYERTLTIGRQNLFADAAGVMQGYRDSGLHIDRAVARRIVTDGSGFAEPLLRTLGAHEVASLDASAYEGSTLVHDLNQSLPRRVRGSYSLVLDGGSLEHVFNFPQALKNCMDAVEPGGHLVCITPANNLFGHGFYQFSPEVFYRALTPANGFRVQLVLVRSLHRWAGWYQVGDPELLGQRVTMTSPWPALLYVLAQRIAPVAPFSDWPQQSDYVAQWATGTRVESRRSKALLRLPAPARRAVRLASAFTGIKDPQHFRRVAMADIAQHASLRPC